MKRKFSKLMEELFVEEKETSLSLSGDMLDARMHFDRCFTLMEGRNKKYGDSWKVLTIQSLANLIEMKMHRIANMNTKDLDPKIEDEFMDSANYAIFGLMALKKKNNEK